MRTWLLVANGVCGRLFKVDKKAKRLIEVADFVNPEARLHEKAYASDSPSRVFDREGPGRQVVEKHARAKEQSKEQFSHELAKYLDEKYKTEKINRLVIVAPSKVLGYMNKELNKTECDHVATKIVKDLTGISAKELYNILEKKLLDNHVY